ncbi:hypothetical protein OSB04_027508 [Centaurea solstitialis]|uniref:Uncharacterized protein n=1 Tax=Centaurea solstitialis TaxID=347529 RepID=A0AA38SXI7_9ASTR|nr:hypothetical protein OSB04_027508 [Centaurea solstitialis]
MGYTRVPECPHDAKEKKFKAAQESSHKDNRWHIVHHSPHGWQLGRLGNIMYACIILYNMILEDEDYAICSLNEHDLLTANVLQITKEQSAKNVVEVRNRKTHINL